MTHAEQQAYEVLLQEAEQERAKWEAIAKRLYVRMDCVESMLAIGRYDLAEQETRKAIREFEGKAA
jgi:hypothetical protein